MGNIDFFLCPDKTSARFLRRILAHRYGALIGQQVGTWLDLYDLVQNSYCLSPPASHWDEKIARTLPTISRAFWINSLNADPDSTERLIAKTMDELLTACGPDCQLDKSITSKLSHRGNRHVSDLIRLNNGLESTLPPDLATIHSLLETPPGQSIRQINVYHAADIQPINPWQIAFLKRLEKDAEKPNNPLLYEEFHELLAWQPRSTAASVLHQLQSQLFLVPEKPCTSRDGLQWIGVRDYLQEVEVAVGMVQQMVAENGTAYQDIGILIPDTVAYTQAADQLFHRAGIPLSDLTVVISQRDLGNELIYQFLHNRKPGVTPPMATAALLGSPLLPWKEKSTRLAQMVMDDAWRSALKSEIPEDQHLLLGNLTGKPITEPARLSASLKALIGHLKQQEELTQHHHTALATIQSLLKPLIDVEEIPWAELFRECRPVTLVSEEEGDVTIEGVTIFHPDRLPWRPVKHLIVLGFEQGRYPAEYNGAAVIPEQDRQSLNDNGILIKTAALQREQARQLFKRQLCSATNTITFLIPRRDPFGEAINPSASLSFMAQLFANVESNEELILELERPEDCKQVKYLAQAKPVDPIPPRPLESDDLELNKNLLTLRKNRKGETAAESPSGLEKLMVSPLAWLLSRYGIDVKAWEAQQLDVLTIGSIAHDVFERCFNHDESLPTRKQLTYKLNLAIQHTLKKDYQFLLEPEWRVEHKQLQSMLLKAAQAWLDFLTRNDIELLAEESWLYGSFNEHPIHGKADLIFSTKSGELFVVDYKTSSSGKRRDTMKNGFDHQTTLYKLMLQKGTLPDDSPHRLKQIQKTAINVGALYYTLRDQTVLGDQLAGELNGSDVIDADISRNALERIRQRMADIRSGKIILNTDQDEDFFEKQAGFTPYALDDSPLIRLFIKEGEES